jgi:hypothetical protein
VRKPSFKYDNKYDNISNETLVISLKTRVSVNECDRGRTRTLNPQSRNLIFYPVELRGQKINETFAVEDCLSKCELQI